MSRNIRDVIAELPDDQRLIVENRAAELIVEEMTLRELRKARKKTQAIVAQELGISQDGVSRLENRSDLLISTLRKTLKAMDAELRLLVEFKDRPAITLRGIGDEHQPRPATIETRFARAAATATHRKHPKPQRAAARR